MIGNDVIDLKRAREESNWRRPGYLQKIFSPGEQAFITASLQPDTTVWLLWSLKEAAYKIHNRQSGKRFYAPQDFTCCSLSVKQNVTAVVNYQGKRYYTASYLSEQRIHTVAAATEWLLQKIRNVAYHQTVYDTHGLPIFYCSLKKMVLPASRSHHGTYKTAVYLDL